MRRRDRIALVLIASVLVVAPFALGGAPRWAICLTTLLALLGAGSFLTSKREVMTVSPLLAFIGLAMILTFLQVVPLPTAVVDLLSPGKHTLVVENAHALGEDPPGWMPTSLDPPATLLELAKLAGYLVFAYSTLRLAASPGRREWLLVVIAAVGGAMAATALIHVVLGAHSVFGVYRPRAAMIRPTLAPLLNHNHLSAMMAFSAPIALGLAIASNARQRLAWLFVTVLCAGVCLLAESRGGAVALVLGLVSLGVLTSLQRRGVRQAARLKRSDIGAIVVLAMSSLVLLGVLTAGGVARDLSGTRMSEISQTGSRFQVWRETSALLSEYRVTGVGRGAFEMASTRIHDSSTITYPHVENEYLQAVVDWGFVGACALAFVLIWLATVAARNARTSSWEAGAFSGLVALAVENLNDFSLWMPGIAYPAIGALAVLTWVPVTEVSSSAKWLRPARVALLVPVAVIAAFAASPIGDQMSAETETVARALAARTDTKAVGVQASTVWARHPASYAAAGLTARALFAARDRRAIAVANRALLLHPTSGELHRLVAQMLLASQQRNQARTEYALAMRYRPHMELMDEIITAFPADDDLVRALPLEPKLINELADRLTERGRVPAAKAYMTRYLTFFPEDSQILMKASALALATDDVTRALENAEQAYRVDPSGDTAITLARAMIKARRAGEAVTLLQGILDRGHIPPHARLEVLVAMAETQVSERQYDAARQSLHQALTLTSGRPAAAIHRKLADVEERSGNQHQAEWELHRAEDLER